MTDLNNISRIYFIGIGGIGMSSLARYFAFHGKAVSGYDRTETALTKTLVSEGIPVHYTDDPELADKQADLVVYTPAVPADHRELNYFREHGYTVLKRSEVLGLVTEHAFNICVAGTHGKTTVTTMIAHILRDSGYGCNAFLGGISVNYQSNFWSSERNVCVVEADEYDRSFLKLSPDIAVVTAMDSDHLDIYGTAEAVREAFIGFSKKLKPGGLLINKLGLSGKEALHAERQLTYAVDNTNADLYATNIRMENGSYHFDLVNQERRLSGITLNMGGLHNVENATAAIGVAMELKIDEGKIKSAMAGFRGVKRRFEYIVKKEGLVYIDDYAHHPEELRALISGARHLFPGRRCTVIFQPHLFSRTKDFARGFAESLDLADEVVLLPIYPARELPIAGVSSALIRDNMKKAKTGILSKEQVLDWVDEQINKKGNGKQLLITAGAGDIDTLVEPLRGLLD